MHKIPNKELVMDMEKRFGLVVINSLKPDVVFKKYTIIREVIKKDSETFFEFEGSKQGNTISILNFTNKKNSLTGLGSWDELNSILAIKALIKWALKYKVTNLIVHTHKKLLFELLWDNGFTDFTLINKKYSNTFSACGKITLNSGEINERSRN